MSLTPAIRSFIHAVPKVELHLHLVGSASPDTVSRLASLRPDLGVPHDPESLARFFAFRDFPHFIEVYATVNRLVATADAIVELVDGSARDLAAQNVRYAEMTVTPYSHVTSGIAYGDVVEALAEGRRRAAERDVEFAWIYDIAGEAGPDAATQTTDWAVRQPPDGLVGFGLSGIEAGVDRASFAEHFDRARAAGLRSVPHAGEGDGPASIWAALGFLRADRIGHGVRAVEDERLLAHLVDHRVPLEVCPSSNICTQVFPSIEEHPIRQMMEAGAVVTVNTDDPPMFGTTLEREYELIADLMTLSVNGVAALVDAAISSSFLADERKRSLHDDVAAIAAVHGGGSPTRHPGDHGDDVEEAEGTGNVLR
jgi:aminodeoxyfutalosine deaminase